MASKNDTKIDYVQSDASQRGRPNYPKEFLSIHTVFGYEGNVRGNVAYNDNDDILYFSAAVGIIQSRTGEQKFHQGHTNDITAIGFSSDKKYIATGDMITFTNKPTIRIWDGYTAQLIQLIESDVKKGEETKCHLLEKKILSLSFSTNSNILCCIGNDSNHSLSLLYSNDGWVNYDRLYNIGLTVNEIFFSQFLNDNTIYIGGSKILFQLNLNLDNINNNSLNRIHFGKCNIDDLLCGLSLSNKFVVGTKSGRIYIVTNNKMIDTKKCHTSAVNCLTLYNEDGYISGGNDFLFNIFDNNGNKLFGFNLKNIISLNQELPDSLIGGINSIYYKNDNILIGTNKCNVIELHTINNFEIDKSTILVQGHSQCEVWGCSTNPNDISEIVSVGDDQYLYIWNIKTTKPIVRYFLPSKSRTVDFHHNGTLVAIGLGGRNFKNKDPLNDNGGFIIFNRNSLQIEFQDLDVSKEWISAIKYSNDDKYLAVGSHDNNVYIYSVDNETNNYNKLYIFNKGSSFVLQFDFSISNDLLRICYGDYQLLYCNINNGLLEVNNELIKEQTWATDNCIIGPDVQGIWADTNDRTDINACCTNKIKTLLIAVDDYNTVRLYRFPSVQKDAAYNQYYGHSSHIPYAEFTSNGRGLVTCGGNDHTVIYWDVNNLE